MPVVRYGRCPICGEPGRFRERCINGNDRCVAGCTYPSSEAVYPKPPKTLTVTTPEGGLYHVPENYPRSEPGTLFGIPIKEPK